MPVPPPPPKPPGHARRRKHLAIGAIAIALLTGGGWALSRSLARSAERRDALELAEKGPPDRALPALLRTLDREPDDPELLRATISTMIEAGSPVADVEPLATRWCRLQPDEPVAFRIQMDVMKRLTRYPEAVAAGERVIQLDSGDDRTRAALANLYLVIGRYDAAANEYQYLLGTSGDAFDLRMGLARAEWEQGNSAEAARITEQILARTPADPTALTLRGLIHHRAGEYEQAVVTFQRARLLKPREREIVLYHLGLSLERLGRSDEARKTFAALTAVQNATRFATDAQQRPDDVALQVRSTEAWLTAEEPDNARQTATAALARCGEHRALLDVLARAYDALGQHNLADQTRSRAAQLP